MCIGIQIKLDWPEGLWSRSALDDELGTIFTRGYAFNDSEFLESADLAGFLSRTCRELSLEEAKTKIRELIPKLNGCWALVASFSNGHIVAACDRIRSIPLFYSCQSDGIIISSSIYPIIDETRPNILSSASVDYLLAGYVTGSDTLYEGIQQIQAGEILDYSPSREGPKLKTTKYYIFLPQSPCLLTENQLEYELEQVLDKVFSRWASILKRHPILLPLSGGWDSRLMAAMLKHHGIKDVLCYTYGFSDNKEMSISREVASVLGYDWEFVEYNTRTWHQWMSETKMQDYWRYCSQGVSLPCFQDLPAVDYVIQTHGLQGGMVLPGFTVFYFEGANISADLHGNEASDALRKIAAAILKDHFILWPSNKGTVRSKIKQELEKRLVAQISLSHYSENVTASALYEMWNMENRQAKFINNSLRTYEFCNRGWALPFWDHELTEFFSYVPEKILRHKRLYLNTMADKIYTGPLQRLREIPRDGGGLLTNRLTDDKPLGSNCPRNIKVLVQKAMEYCRLSGIYRKSRLASWYRRRHFLKTGGHHMGFNSWFTKGLNPLDVAVDEVLEEHNVRKYLPSSMHELIDVPPSKRVYEILPNGLLSAVTLAGMYEGQAKVKCKVNK